METVSPPLLTIAENYMRCIMFYDYIVNDSCTEGLVRLVEGRTPNEGVVEICLDGVWGRITPSNWGVTDAEVVCRQLGLPWNCKITLTMCMGMMAIPCKSIFI